MQKKPPPKPLAKPRKRINRRFCCDRCNDKGESCDGQRPCSLCTSTGLTCHYSVTIWQLAKGTPKSTTAAAPKGTARSRASEPTTPTSAKSFVAASTRVNHAPLYSAANTTGDSLGALLPDVGLESELDVQKMREAQRRIKELTLKLDAISRSMVHPSDAGTEPLVTLPVISLATVDCHVRPTWVQDAYTAIMAAINGTIADFCLKHGQSAVLTTQDMMGRYARQSTFSSASPLSIRLKSEEERLYDPQLVYPMLALYMKRNTRVYTKFLLIRLYRKLEANAVDPFFLNAALAFIAPYYLHPALEDYWRPTPHDDGGEAEMQDPASQVVCPRNAGRAYEERAEALLMDAMEMPSIDRLYALMTLTGSIMSYGGDSPKKLSVFSLCRHMVIKLRLHLVDSPIRDDQRYPKLGLPSSSTHSSPLASAAAATITSSPEPGLQSPSSPPCSPSLMVPPPHRLGRNSLALSSDAGCSDHDDENDDELMREFKRRTMWFVGFIDNMISLSLSLAPGFPMKYMKVNAIDDRIMQTLLDLDAPSPTLATASHHGPSSSPFPTVDPYPILVAPTDESLWGYLDSPIILRLLSKAAKVKSRTLFSPSSKQKYHDLNLRFIQWYSNLPPHAAFPMEMDLNNHDSYAYTSCIVGTHLQYHLAIIMFNTKSHSVPERKAFSESHPFGSDDGMSGSSSDSDPDDSPYCIDSIDYMYQGPIPMDDSDMSQVAMSMAQPDASLPLPAAPSKPTPTNAAEARPLGSGFNPDLDPFCHRLALGSAQFIYERVFPFYAALPDVFHGYWCLIAYFVVAIKYISLLTSQWGQQLPDDQRREYQSRLVTCCLALKRLVPYSRNAEAMLGMIAQAQREANIIPESYYTLTPEDYQVGIVMANGS
ncbi:hypothetical protein H4R34_001649 [Dimargaris verticillata]|uniref:Zn(2)-C6 fungal-type domain-containing protein n=1 Tax=Dimargaris verticillata TaxID=2761393 RepID=A0A9W8EAQ9_9FUNG|nr:hypothetical protein H4R34_001649 [Dimargaris verticillata]